MNDTDHPSPSAVSVAVQALIRRLAWIAIIFAAGALLLGNLLSSYGFALSLYQTLLGLLSLSVLLPSVLATDLLVLHWFLGPIRKLLSALHKDALDASTAQQALIRALNLPLLTVIRILTFHALVGLGGSTMLTFYGNAMLNLGWQMWQILIIWGEMLVIVVAHAIFEYYAVTRVVRPVIPLIRAYAGDLSPEHRRRIIPVGVGSRLLALSVWMAFMPLVLLAYTSLLRVSYLMADLGLSNAAGLLSPVIQWNIILIVLLTVVTLAVALLMSRDTALLARDMVAAMRQVEGGDLESRLEIVSTDEFAALYQGFNRMTRGLQERERLRDAFGRYVAPEVAEQVMRDGVKLGGETVTATVLFADIRGFTSLSERMAAPQVVALLNRYFAAVEPAIEAEGGWINKFGGDSLLAVFGAPVLQPDHTHRAVCAALAMRGALASFNHQQRASGGPELRIGVGIDCGEMVAGSVGSPDRMEYTVIGDTVNTASRIEALNKDWQTDILISDEVYQAVRGQVGARPMPLAEVRGKSELVQVYAVT